MNMDHMDYLETIAAEDVQRIREKEASYKGSWKKRGGIGAFMMLARKWDRIENAVQSLGITCAVRPENRIEASPYDIFMHIQIDEREEGLLSDIQDLRCYLMLVEAEMRARHERTDHGLGHNND
jgi:hypothetical protein